MLEHDLRRGITGIRRLARQQREERRAQRVDVAAMVQLSVRGLLGTHVQRRASDDASLGQSAGVKLRIFDQAKVHQLGTSRRRTQDVIGLDIAMDEAHLVRGMQRGAAVGDDLGRLAPLHRATLFDVARC